MSGGALNYFYAELESHVGDFEDKELDELVKDLADLFAAREWFLSGDTCEGNWNEERNKFKKKWFSDRQERVKKYVLEAAEELKRQFGIGLYCRDCVCWIEDKVKDYGRCPHHKSCLMHKCENACEHFEPLEVEK